MGKAINNSSINSHTSSRVMASSLVRALTSLAANNALTEPAQQGYGQQGQGQYQQHQPPPGPPQGHQQSATQILPQSDSGSFQGGNYSITHRDTNAVLTVDLQQGSIIHSKSGAMIHMAGTVQLTGQVKFSMKKLFTGGALTESAYAGPGKVALGPTLFGDIITLHVDGRQQWKVGKDAFLARTPGVSKDTKSQGIGKAMFSGEDLFVYHIAGQGLLWLTSFGAVDRLDVSIVQIYHCLMMGGVY